MGDTAAMEATMEEDTEEDMGDTTEAVGEEVIAATVAATEITVGAYGAVLMPEKLFRHSPVTKTI
ncbi:hypothetical protein F2Q70_00028186 [Brassica cretica]|uniref:Uncharacterized protein n=1 Tax=Brassica cretica TaxID=69181 RepID=A0A8S9LJE9_BRACR|nr:hypothetical protein F2Q70_00028186 [Brassica cretica]KAF3576543.1 hypothetical protein DY000_02034890 [Brassica cretica]